MSTATPKKNMPHARRLSQVYVEIPPSPLLSQIRRNSSSVHVPSLSRKENTPLRPSKSSMTQEAPSSIPTSQKRKHSAVFVEIDSPAYIKAKKAKVADIKVIDKPVASKPSNFPLSVKIQAVNTSEEFPNGYFYCHQCAKKRDATLGIQCTMKDSKEGRCRQKYCRSCLKNRYGGSADDIDGVQSTNAQHILGEGYTFKCPKCRDICNCRRCRKAKGLKPTGNLTNAARRLGISAAGIIHNDPTATGILPGKRAQAVPEKKTKAPKDIDATTKKATENSKQKSNVKILPTFKWMEVPLYLSLEDTEARFHVREFVLRFAPLMDIGRGHLEELEEIAGIASARAKCGTGEEDEEMTPWVSEPCVKNMVQGILQLFVGDETRFTKAVKQAVKDIRACGANLYKVWGVLESMRASLADIPECPLVTFPDPLPPPSSAKLYNTRGMRSLGSDGPSRISVTQSAQMVPVLVAFVNAALQTDPIREEIENGVKEGKEKTNVSRDAIKRENERWGKQKNEKGAEAKSRRIAHKRILLDHQMALKVAMNQYAPRSGPLGTDRAGRVYWALCPGPLERQAAVEFITGENVGRNKSARALKKLMPSEEERMGMRSWSWFVGVWGKRPDDALVHEGKANKIRAEGDESDDSSGDDGGESRWWGFWEPSEIRKLAEWVAIKNELGDGTRGGSLLNARALGSSSDVISRAVSPTEVSDDEDRDGGEDISMVMSAGISSQRDLVKRLNEYADLLEWRVEREDVAGGVKETGKSDAESAKSRTKGSLVGSTISGSKFYR